MFCTHTEGPHHDCRYVEERNKLIPVAERLALQAVGEPPPGFDDPAYDARFGVAFLRAMDLLWRAPKAVQS